MSVKQSWRGPFLGCLNYPSCRGTSPVPEEMKAELAALAPVKPAGPDLKSIVLDETCDQCGASMVARKGRRGYFLGCSNYPKCKGTREPSEASLEKILAVTGP
jgi:DNA topoisomerase-1